MVWCSIGRKASTRNASTNRGLASCAAKSLRNSSSERVSAGDVLNSESKTGMDGIWRKCSDDSKTKLSGRMSVAWNSASSCDSTWHNKQTHLVLRDMAGLPCTGRRPGACGRAGTVSWPLTSSKELKSGLGDETGALDLREHRSTEESYRLQSWFTPARIVGIGRNAGQTRRPSGQSRRAFLQRCQNGASLDSANFFVERHHIKSCCLLTPAAKRSAFPRVLAKTKR